MIPRKSWHIRYSCFLAFSLALCTSRPIASPQVTSSESSLRVAFVFSIAKFIEWPEAEFTGPITICAANPLPETQEALNQLHGKTLQGKSVNVVLLSAKQVSANQLDGCRLLYQEAESDVAFSSQLPLGTVFIRDHSSVSNLPPSIVLWLGTDGHLNFSVDRTRLASTGAKVSSQLLKLAKPPRD